MCGQFQRERAAKTHALCLIWRMKYALRLDAIIRALKTEIINKHTLLSTVEAHNCELLLIVR